MESNTYFCVQMKYYIIAGEASGDLHGANLMKELKKKDAQAEFRFWGGDLMQQQGGTLVKHYRELAFMGFVEVIRVPFTRFIVELSKSPKLTPIV